MKKQNLQLPNFEDEIKKLQNISPCIQILATTYKHIDHEGSLREKTILIPPLDQISSTQLFMQTAENSSNKDEIIKKFYAKDMYYKHDTDRDKIEKIAQKVVESYPICGHPSIIEQ